MNGWLRKILAALSVALALGAVPGGALALSGKGAADNLRTGCAGMGIVPSIIAHGRRPYGNSGTWDKKELGKLLRMRLRNAAESRLRAAKLFDFRMEEQYLAIRVMVAQSRPLIAYTSLSLNRYAYDTGYGRGGRVEVWSIGSLTRHHSDIQKAIDIAVSVLLDKFLTEYLRANPECGK